MEERMGNLHFKRSRRFDPGKFLGEAQPDTGTSENPSGTGMTESGQLLFPKSQEQIDREEAEAELKRKINEIRKKRGLPVSA